MKTLIGILEGFGKSTLAAYLVMSHRFVQHSVLPRSMAGLANGARVVVVLNLPTTPRQRATFERRVHKLGGTVVRIDREARVPYVGLPNPPERSGKPEVMFEAADGMLVGRDQKGRGLRPVPPCRGT